MLYLGGHFVGSNLRLSAPVPDMTLHVMLGSDGHNVLQVGRKGLGEKERERWSEKPGQGHTGSLGLFKVKAPKTLRKHKML